MSAKFDQVAGGNAAGRAMTKRAVGPVIVEPLHPLTLKLWQ
jgi:hypothetical protein